MKIVTVLGARPQFIKAATVSRHFLKREGLHEVIIHTGQHFDSNMSNVFFAQLDIPKPAYNLGIGGGLHGAMTGRQLEEIEKVLIAEQPDWVLVYGDTNSTLAGALAAAKLQIRIAHIEAGLRSFNRRMPEEINRILTDHVAELLFAPSETAVRNLVQEGISPALINLSGDVMYDAALYYRSRAVAPTWFPAANIIPGEFVLATIHRSENTDDEGRLRAIFQGLAASRLPVILPLHPRTRIIIERIGLIPSAKILLVPPVGYLEMLWLEMNCRLVATDSGGVQKEAYFNGKFCVTLRDETEWVELVECGWNSLAGADSSRISSLIEDAQPPDSLRAIYGHGDAAEKIVDCLSTL